jgi:PAS domain S-box-containing protein
MVDAPTETRAERQLRIEAESRLKAGLAPPSKAWPANLDALTLLYKLASSPATASDALKLLHELQVHQVEIDLLDAQFADVQTELNEDLAHYKALFDHAPVGYLIVSLEHGHIMDSNPSAARLLGVAQAQLDEHDFREFLTSASAPALANVLQALRAGSAQASCRAQSRAADNGHGLQIHASLFPNSEAAMVALSTVDLE